MRAKGALPGPITSAPSAVQIITPCNVPIVPTSVERPRFLADRSRQAVCEGRS
jgi:hypothetical protein